MTNLRVLLIEDEQSNIELWQDAVATHNADAESLGFAITTAVARTVVEAKEHIDTWRCDAAVVDLRLRNPAQAVGPNDDGNLLVREVIKRRPVGVVIYTGQRNEAGDFDGVQVRVLDRGDGLEPVFAWLKEYFQLFIRLRGVRDVFEQETAKVFFTSIWPRWKHWVEEIGDNEALSRLVARHVMAHAHDSMLSREGESVHPEETYFVPSIKTWLDTGDLLRLDGDVWIVVTPRCDMAREGKVKSVLLCRCRDISAEWDEILAAGGNIEKKTRRLMQHDQQPKQHFLPRLSDAQGHKLGPWMVDFHDLRAIDAEQARRDLPGLRFASLSPQFVPSLTERFGAYFSRIGTPELSAG